VLPVPNRGDLPAGRAGTATCSSSPLSQTCKESGVPEMTAA
jgi:hypothetical protein